MDNNREETHLITNSSMTSLHDDSDNINCPACGSSIVISEAISIQLQKLSVDKVEKELYRARLSLESGFAKERGKLLQELEEAREKIKLVTAARKDFLKKEKDFDELLENKELEFLERLAKERRTVRIEQRRLLDVEIDKRIQEKNEDLSVLRARLKEAESNESVLRRKQAEVNAKENALELELERRLEFQQTALTKRITEEAGQKALIEVQRRELEITRLRDQIKQLNQSSHPSELTGELWRS